MKYILISMLLLFANIATAQQCEKPHKSTKKATKKMTPQAIKTVNAQLNVLGEALQPCCFNPLTGYTRNGSCETIENDYGVHVICANLTIEFLEYSKAQGNDLMTPTAYFPGLKAGDQWCLCAVRWREALVAGVAPPVVLASTHQKALQFVTLEDLKAHSK
jgi:uncharacterized protein